MTIQSAPVQTDANSPQDQRDRALDTLLAFVKEQVAGAESGLTINVHRCPVSLFTEDGPFDKVAVRTRDDGKHRYLVGEKNFGGDLLSVPGFTVTCFSRDLEERS